MALEITELARKFAPWSISKASIAAECPRQFEHKYLVKTAEAIVPSVNRVGTVSHAILELRTGGTPQAVAKKAALEKTPLTSAEMDSLLVLEKPIDWFMRKWDSFCRTQHVVEIMREQKWGLTIDLLPTPFFSDSVFFRGVLDLGVLTQSGDLIVLDHKSGIAKDIQKDLKYKRQINSYGVLARYNIPNLVGIRGAIHFLQGSDEKRIQWLDYVSAGSIETNLTPWLFNHLNYCASHLTEPFQARPKLRWPCEWCSYTNACRAYQEMIHGKQQGVAPGA